MGEHLILVDASGFAYRAFHAASPRYREEDGEPTGAVEVFLSMVWRMLGAAQADPPTMGAAIFDFPGPTFRHELFPAYKGGRDPARRKELAKQFAIMRPAAEVLGLAPLEIDGFEADDLIATLAHRAAKAGIRVTIVSSDKDFGQCVVAGEVEIVDPMLKKRVTETDVLKRWGVVPSLVPHVQALAGDPVDGVPGIPGCGLRTAAELVREYGTVAAVLKGFDSVRPARLRAQLRRAGKVPLTYLKLTKLRKDVPIRVNFEDLRLKPIVKAHLMEMLKALGAAGRAESIFGLDPVLLRPVAPVKDPLTWWREELKASGQRLPDEPQCGFYMRKLQQGGAFVPARIWREPEYNLATDEPTGRDLLRCQVGDKARDPLAEWPRLSMTPIPKAEYERMMTKWQPGRRPPDTGPTDLTKVKSIPNPKRKSHA